VIPAHVFIPKHRFLAQPNHAGRNQNLPLRSSKLLFYISYDPTTHLLRICVLLNVSAFAIGSLETPSHHISSDI
jgi:hypothetical protein